MSDEQRIGLSGASRQKFFNEGASIVGEDEREDFCAIVICGVAKLSRTFSNGRRQVVGLLFPSDIVGRPFGTSPYQVDAATDILLCLIDKNRFEHLIRDNPRIEHGFSEHTLDELDAAREWMLVLGRMTAAEKVASFLLMVARRAEPVGHGTPGEASGRRVALPLDRSGVADYLGLRIETVSRQFTNLRQQSIIDTEEAGRVVRILDLPALERVAREPGS
jgi:CRP/FNR family transcriptional regulator